MRKNLLFYPILSALLIIFTILPVAAAQFSPAVFSIDQDVVDGTVTVTRVTSNVPGWIVIHADDDGAPGPVLGQSAVPSGITADVVVDVATEGVTDTLWAMLHVDEGTAGEYEFPGDDVPVTVNDEIVMYPFAIGEVAQSIAGVAASTEGFGTLVQAVEAAGLLETLQTEGPLTVFAPTDDAFAAVPAETLDALLADPEQLTQVLLYHVVPGSVLAADVTDGLEAETVQGSTLSFTVDADGVMVNDANVTATDIMAYNGVIHVIDQVLLPPAPEEAVMEDAPAAEEEATEEEATDEAAAEEEAADEAAADETATDEDAADSEELADAEATATPAPEEEMADETAADEEAAESEEMSEDEAADSEEMATEEAPAEEMTDEEMTDEEMAEEEMVDAAMDGTPSVTVIDQGSTGTNVAVIQAVATQAGWVVIHADEGGAPGAVLGQASIPAGTTDNIIVTLDEPISGEVALWAMLHVDDGEAGVYEFPGADGPVSVDNEIVMAPFTAIVTGADTAATDEEMADEEMATEETAEEEMTDESMTDESMAEEEMADDSMADESMAEEEMADDSMADENAMAAPDMLPQTGFSAASNTSHLPMVVVIIAGLFGMAVITRRTKR